jgi:hypothetical protein
MPGDVAEREDGLVADHLPVGGVERAAVLLGEGALSVSDRVGLELEVGGGLRSWRRENRSTSQESNLSKWRQPFRR